MPVSVKPKVSVRPKGKAVKKKKTINQNLPIPLNVLRQIRSKLNNRTMSTVAQTCKQAKQFTKSELKRKKKRELRRKRRLQFENKIRNEIGKIELSKEFNNSYNFREYLQNWNNLFRNNSNLLTNLDKQIIKHILIKYMESDLQGRNYTNFPPRNVNSFNPQNIDNLHRFRQRRKVHRTSPFRFLSRQNLSI